MMAAFFSSIVLSLERKVLSYLFLHSPLINLREITLIGLWLPLPLFLAFFLSHTEHTQRIYIMCRRSPNHLVMYDL